MNDAAALVEPEQPPLTSRAAKGAAWLVTARWLTKAIDFVSLLILARLLGPAEFGIVAVAMTLVQIIEAVLELPVFQVLIGLRRIERFHLDTAFTLGVLRGLLLAGLLALLAVPFARFYGDGRLVALVAVLSLAPAIRGLGSPRMVTFVSMLDFRRDFAVELSGKLVAFALSVAAAFWLRDYRAIVIGTLTTPAVMTITSYALAPYRPRLSLAAWPLFAHFIGWTTAAQFLNALNWQCDRLILGRFVSHAQLGVFSLANDLSYLPEQALIKPILRPLVSAFALIKDDAERLSAAYAKTSVTVLALGAPVMLGMSMLASPAVRLVLGGKWMAAIPMLHWLPLTLIPPLFVAPMISLAFAMGRPEVALRTSLFEAALKLPSVAIGAAFFGIGGVIVARMVSAVAVAMVSIVFVRRLIGTPLRNQMKSAWRVMVSSGVLTFVLFVLRPLLDDHDGFGLLVRFAAVGIAGLASYILGFAILWHLSGRPPSLESAVFGRLAALVARRRASPDAASGRRG